MEGEEEKWESSCYAVLLRGKNYKKKKNCKNNVNKCKDKKREKISTLTDSASRTAKSV